METAMESIKRFLGRETPPPELEPESMIGRCEYYTVFIIATTGFIISYGCLFLIIYLYFYGVFNDEVEGYGSEDRRVHNPPRRLYNGNFHVIVSGILPVFTANGVIVYRSVCCGSHGCAKIFHVGLGILPIPLIVYSFSYTAEWWKYSANPHNNYRHYTYHDWIGFSYVGIFLLQFIIGIVVYGILPRRHDETVICRARFSPYHTSFGLAVFIWSVVACLTGIVAYAGTIYSDVAAYRVKTIHTKLHNIRQTTLQIAAVLYALPAVPVVYVLAKEQFKLFGPAFK